MPKIDGVPENYLTTEIWEESRLREIFYGTLIFWQSSMICISHHVGGQEWQPKLLFACILIVKRLIAMLRCAENNTTSFQQFPWSL